MSAIVILITGAASGIGRALALNAHARGHTVYATDRDTDALAGLAALGLRTQRLDVTSAADIAALVARLDADGVGPDMLINNAGFGAIAPVLEISPDRLRAQFEVNVFAIVSLCQALAPRMMARQQGRIVNIGSISGLVTTPFAGAYCASKAAVHAFSDALRMELKPFGIRVMTVQPGGIRSDFGAAAAQAASAGLRADSRYAAVADGILARAEASQDGAMSAEDFAERMLTEVLAAQPRAVIRIGRHSTLLPLARQLVPTHWLDARLSREFGLERLTTTTNSTPTPQGEEK
ncbi:MAG: SDR family NAD(P)-dependent oxidoreductase [Pseudomonadota bacterium]